MAAADSIVGVNGASRVDDAGRDALAARSLALFAFMWAVFTFFHQSKPAYWTRTPLEALQTAAAVAVIFRPSSLGAFLALVAIQLADLFHTLPYITNHSVFAMFVDLTIALAVIVELLRRRGFPLDGGRLWRLFAPAVRLEVIALYFWVVVHKLNSDFISVDASCAVDHYLHLKRLGFLATGMHIIPDHQSLRMMMVWLTLIVEAAIPLLLLRQGTRIAGVMLGLLFHYALGVNTYHDFSGMIYATYLMFLPANFADEALAWGAGLIASLAARTRRAAALLRRIPLALWIAILAIGVLVGTGNTWLMLHPIFFRIWFVYGAFCIAAFAAVVYLRRSRFEFEPRAFRMHPALVLCPALVFLNGTAPYLGLKTENSFAMYSNLRTEYGYSNHFFFPASLQVFDYQKDKVTITQSSDPYLKSTIGRSSMPYLGLMHYIRKQRRLGIRNIEVAYMRGGVERHVPNADLDPELSGRSHSWLVRKFLVFREVDDGPRQQCKH